MAKVIDLGVVLATPEIGENGNWFVNGVDMQVKAQGPVGPQGPIGPQGPDGKPGPRGPGYTIEVDGTTAIITTASNTTASNTTEE